MELFLLTKNGESSSSSTGELDVLLNEVAPRPHNMGHYTQDARHSTLHLRIVDIDGFSIIIYSNDSIYISTTSIYWINISIVVLG